MKYDNIVIRGPKDVYCCIEKLGGKKTEHFGVMLLDAGNHVIADKILFKGGVHSTIVDMRPVFWFACKHEASHMVVYHNHPSQNVTPSEHDTGLTMRLKTACDYIGIQLMDSMIIAKDGQYYSFAEDRSDIMNKNATADLVVNAIIRKE